MVTGTISVGELKVEIAYMGAYSVPLHDRSLCFAKSCRPVMQISSHSSLLFDNLSSTEYHTLITVAIGSADMPPFWQ